MLWWIVTIISVINQKCKKSFNEQKTDVALIKINSCGSYLVLLKYSFSMVYWKGLEIKAFPLNCCNYWLFNNLPFYALITGLNNIFTSISLFSVSFIIVTCGHFYFTQNYEHIFDSTVEVIIFSFTIWCYLHSDSQSRLSSIVPFPALKQF